MKKINPLLPVLFLFYLCLLTLKTDAQKKVQVLFLGNSYTSENNLPKLIHDVALSSGDTIQYDSYSPGGYQLIDHVADQTTLQKIKARTWDYVVIQGQSQEPIIRSGQFNNGALSLYNLIKQHNPCAEVITYMTWGRKNGDRDNCAAFPVMCTYMGMDTVLRKAYLQLSRTLSSATAPASVVWSEIRKQNPGVELYQPDESHPSLAGSYAAACCFYSSILNKNPTTITYNPGLNSTDAANIRRIVKSHVYDSLKLWDFKRGPVSDFGFEIGSGLNEVKFLPRSQGIRQSYHWDFGDGITSTAFNPTHFYSGDGAYQVRLTTTVCDFQGMHTSVTNTTIQFCSHTPTIYTANPWLCKQDTLWTQPADAYVWYMNGERLTETKQFLPDYYRYGMNSYAVRATVNGCSEWSKPFVTNPEFSGYYFDALGNPCDGDTVVFAVLHTNGSLPGGERINWLKNGRIIPALNNKDTMVITESGTYECRVINPNSRCPIDTTSMVLEFDCEPVKVGRVTKAEGLQWTVFPNPVKDNLIVEFNNQPRQETLMIFDVMGKLLMSKEISSSVVEIGVGTLPPGIYIIQLKSKSLQPVIIYKL